MTIVDAPVGIREVTVEEGAFFDEHGWVKLEALVAPDVVAKMLSWAKDALAPGTEPGRATTNGKPPTLWRERRFMGRDTDLEPFGSIAMSTTSGRNAMRMGGRGASARYWADIVACKVPRTELDGNESTPWHQDFCTVPHDRVGIHTFWIAIDE